VEATERNFSSTQRINQLASREAATKANEFTAEQRWLHQRFFQAPASRWRLIVRLLRPRFSSALMTPVIAGVALALWQGAPLVWPTILLLLTGSSITVIGLNLLHEYNDYQHAFRSNEIKFMQTVFATSYHLMVTGLVKPSLVRWLGYGLLGVGLGCYLALLPTVGWPLLFFYAMSLLLAYMYTAPPLRYSYHGWGLGELGLFFGYGFLPLLGSYYIVSQNLTLVALFTTIPFGIAAILLFGNYNFIHHRRDWLMRKRTLVVTAGPTRLLGINALLTLAIYVALLCIVSLAHLPVIGLLTLAALPLAIRIYGELRGDEIGLEESFQLYRATVTGVLWTTTIFCLALLVDKSF
jgi:1,4-dihydroxy-2-naphthoate octaprenyltransferase